MADVSLASRLAGGVWGHLVGDAVGVPYEFKPPSAITSVVFGAPNGIWNQPPGTWSDDGALMLALLDSLLGGAVGRTRFDPEDQGQRAVAWYQDGAYTPDGHRFDIGNTTRHALDGIARGIPALEAARSDEHASSNGSLMRILPIALVGRDLSDAELVEHAHLASRVTHAQVRCEASCALYVLMARSLLGASSRSDALATSIAALRALYASEDRRASHRQALDELEAHRAREGRGYVLDAFWSAWDAFAGAGSYRETIERAVAYGNDTDTTAAIAGGLAGIYWGWEGIPVEWRRGMRGKAVAEPFVDRLVATTGARTSTLSPLRVDWIDLDGLGMAVAGRLGITFLPGKKRDGFTGPHWRDLDLDVARLVELGVDQLILLVEDSELDACLVADLPDAIAAADIELIRYPIRDPRVPIDVSGFAVLIEQVAERVAEGTSVAIACRGGMDRSGLAAACVLITLGATAREAVERVHLARKRSLTITEQLDYVAYFKPRKLTSYDE